jgi:hypothetical protein
MLPDSIFIIVGFRAVFFMKHIVPFMSFRPHFTFLVSLANWISISDQIFSHSGHVLIPHSAEITVLHGVCLGYYTVYKRFMESRAWPVRGADEHTAS